MITASKSTAMNSHALIANFFPNFEAITPVQAIRKHTEV